MYAFTQYGDVSVFFDYMVIDHITYKLGNNKRQGCRQKNNAFRFVKTVYNIKKSRKQYHCGNGYKNKKIVSAVVIIACSAF